MTSNASKSFNASKYPMMPMDDAMEMVLKHAESYAAACTKKTVPLAEAFGHVLATDVVNHTAIPSFRASIMDGYAIQASDFKNKKTFPISHKVHAGENLKGTLPCGTVCYVTTGAPVPAGADAVVKVEETSTEESTGCVEITSTSVHAGQNIREIGSDIAAQEVVLSAGTTVIGAAEIGILAMVGKTSVEVVPRPVVGVLSTGDELLTVETYNDEESHTGKIRDSNRPMLCAAVKDAGFDCIDLGLAADEKDTLKHRVLEALTKVDILVTSGGVSMGDKDYVKPLLETLGTVHFGRLFMKPGKPTTFATVNDKLVFGLPGNPVSSLVTFHLMVLPALKRISGITAHNMCVKPKIKVRLLSRISLDATRPEYHRAAVHWNSKELVATSTGFQRSSRLLSCTQSNALLCLPPGSELAAGSLVDAILVGNILPMNAIEKHKIQRATPEFSACILTVSDRVSQGVAEDHSGPAIRDFFSNMDRISINVLESSVVPDEIEMIQAKVKGWCDNEKPTFIVTTGGTGFSPRDVTPEAVKSLIERETPGLVFRQLQAGLEATHMAILSRPVAGIRKETLIMTFPGKPKAVIEGLEAVKSVLPHAFHLVRDLPHEHHKKPRTTSEPPLPQQQNSRCTC